MNEIFKLISSFYFDWLQPNFLALIHFLANNQYAIYASLALIVVLSIVRAKVKIPKLQQWLDFVCGMIAVLLMIVAYYIFSPGLNKFFDSIHFSTPTNSTTDTTDTTGTTTQPTTTTKQLYHAVGCSSCQNSSCPSNGYSYGGYDTSYYDYIVALCRSCSCSSLRASSFWK